MDTASAQQQLRKAMQLQQGGQLQKAKEIYLQILSELPEHPDALHLYGLACHQQGDHQTAVSYIRKAVELVPGQAVLHNNLGDALHRAGDISAAITQFRIALDLKPDYAGACQNLGSVYAGMGNHDAALKYARKSVRLDECRPEAWFNLGLSLLDQVLLNDAVDAFRHALALRPDYSAAVTAVLYLLNLIPDADPSDVADQHREVAGAAFRTAQAAPQQNIQNERIRVGYVSGDFCAHAVNYFFEPVLEQHDQARFETYCYSDVRQPDAVTHRLQQSASHWRNIVDYSDEALFRQIRNDRIDILVDLAGYTKHHRMAMFARKPAALQIGWLGYPNTSGLESMDYRLVDVFTSPLDEAVFGTEIPIRLTTGFACFRPPAQAPAIQNAPVLRNGFVTLGCLHKLEKLNTQVIELWAQLMQQNPSTRLLLARDQLDEWHQQRLLRQFQQHGIGADRLEMIALCNPAQSFFELFAEIDILLDVFPWSGHTLACCALWMGVPVVSLYGISHAGRMVASVLRQLQLDELIAKDKTSYQRIVHELCNEPSRLTDYRKKLRLLFENSPMRDEAGFTRDLEKQMQKIHFDR